MEAHAVKREGLLGNGGAAHRAEHETGVGVTGVADIGAGIACGQAGSLVDDHGKSQLLGTSVKGVGIGFQPLELKTEVHGVAALGPEHVVHHLIGMADRGIGWIGVAAAVAAP
jgi:hypothetical protein